MPDTKRCTAEGALRLRSLRHSTQGKQDKAVPDDLPSVAGRHQN